MNKRTKLEKGITLIALVITIIVLLILAGVSIASLTGENGLLNKAELAVNEYLDKATEEKKILDEYAEYIESQGNLIDESKPGKPYISNGIYTETSTKDGKEKSAKNPSIPAGFKPVDTPDAKWGDGSVRPKEEEVDNGLVIEDKDGNQFVWVPVDGENLKYKKHTYTTETADDTKGVTGDTGNGNWRTYHYRNYTDWEDRGTNIDSVTENGGFYVGRYEAGIPSNADFYGNNDGETYYTNETNPSKNVATYIPVSKERNPSWNYIEYKNALIVSSKMYERSNSVTSSLIDGIAWDTITTWMDNEIPGLAKDSTNYGNHYNSTTIVENALYAVHSFETKWEPDSNYNYGKITLPGGIGTEKIELSTGILEIGKIKNIYDMTGNMNEWTAEEGYHGEEKTGTQYAVLRGGSFNHKATLCPLSCKHGNYIAENAGADVGFRVVLYLK